eukprot:m.208182 g.208182  ORF g.208182 m.208182 type:complete len:314 (+) comp18959_c0_seq5:131-1072(+)
MAQELYEAPATGNSDQVPLYETTDVIAPSANLDSLHDLVKADAGPVIGGGGIKGMNKINLDEPPPPDAPEAVQKAYYDALAAHARANRNEIIHDDDMIQQDRPVEDTSVPSADQRRALMEQAMSSARPTDEASEPIGGGTGPSKSDRQKLLEQAMAQASIGAPSSGGGGGRPDGPTKSDRQRLLDQAMASHKDSGGPPPPSSSRGGNGPTEEQRRKLLMQAQSMAKSDPSPPSSRSGSTRADGPTDEQRRKLLEQAMAGSRSAAPAKKSGPSQEEKLRLMNQALSGASASRGASTPSNADRQRLLDQALKGSR